jgi:hypothetical protein
MQTISLSRKRIFLRDKPDPKPRRRPKHRRHIRWPRDQSPASIVAAHNYRGDGGRSAEKATAGAMPGWWDGRHGLLSDTKQAAEKRARATARAPLYCGIHKLIHWLKMPSDLSVCVIYQKFR